MAILDVRDKSSIMMEINVTPFTDVLLVLLIIFMMLAALVAPPGFQKHLPCNCGKGRAPAAKPVDVVVDERGRIFVGQRATDDLRIYADLRAALSASKSHAISLVATGKAPYAKILRVLDAAKADGNADVTLVVGD